MAGTVPTKYNDPFWVDLATKTESKLELPKGVLVALINNGERSNHDALSSAGARTVMQIIPETRKAAIEKYGIDPYLSPENAVEVGGLLLKDSLQRNKGDVALAVAEYHGGTNRENWGPKTKAYVQRVTAALPTLDATGFTVGKQGESTFDRVSKQMQPQATNQIAAVYDAYKSGKMTPEEAAEFEADVQAGKLMLPRGASLATQAKPQQASGAMELPREVANAYELGQMTPQEKADLERDLAAGLVKLPPSLVSQIPGGAKPEEYAKEPESSIVDKVVGAGEAALTVATGATAGTLAGAVETGQGIIDSVTGSGMTNKQLEQKVVNTMGEYTYSPRTAEGQKQAAAVGHAMQNLIPLVGVTPQVAAITQAAKPSAVQAAQAVKAGANKAATVGKQVAATVAENMPGNGARGGAGASSTPGTMGSAGAAATDLATQRRALGSNFPVPLEGDRALTKGQATRDFAQTQFEREAAKNAEEGAPLRERFENQNKAILQNFDAWIDQTGAEAPSLRETGLVVTKAIKSKADAVKTKIRDLYKKADEAGELEAPIKLEGLVKHINESAPEASTAPVLDVARRKLVQIGAATEGDAGQLIALDVPLKKAEMVRQSISRATNYEPTNIRQATIMKGIIDEQTEGLGGNMYKQARKVRAQFAREFENRAVISDMINNKRGMDDRKVAFEDVHKRAIIDGSLDDVRMVRRTLQTQGDEGKQAWRELQGQTVQYLKDQATKNVATNSRGDAVVSPAGLDRAIKTLDKDGKLDFIFGKKDAQQLRDINELSKVILTTTPNAVNNSNTASILLAALDMGMTAAAGLPLPVASGLRMLTRHIKDSKLRARIKDALNSQM